MADTTTTTRKPSTLDLSALAPVAAELPKVEREQRDNPFTAWLAESYEGIGEGDSQGPGKSVTVPAANVSEVEYLIRKAANGLGIGSRVVVQNAKGETLDKDARKSAKGNLRVLFAAKERKQRKTGEAGTGNGDTAPSTTDE